MMEKNKRGNGHIETVLSFIIFISFVIFLFSVFPVYKSGKSKVGLDSAERGILNFTGSKLTYFTIAINGTPSKCFYFDYYVSGKAIVKNASGERVEAKSSGDRIYINDSSDFYNIYISDEFVENSFPIENCENLSKLPHDLSHDLNYEKGLVREEDVISYNKTLALIERYNSSYATLKTGFGIPKGEDFGFRITDLKGIVMLNTTKKRIDRIEVLASNVPEQVIYENGSSVFVMLNIQTW